MNYFTNKFFANAYFFLSFLYIFFSLVSPVLILDYFVYFYLVLLFMYILGGIFFYFYWGYLGTRGLFYSFELILFAFFISTLITIYFVMRFGMSFDIFLFELMVSESFSFYNSLQFNLLSLIGVSLVSFLTFIILTFALEYLLRELIAYDVIATLFCFSASIIAFIVSNNFGLMVMCWELSGTFSLLLVDMYYSRVRTTQAASRTFAISRFSDYVMFIAVVELISLCSSDSMYVILDILPYLQFDLSLLGLYFYDCNSADIILLTIFLAACTKSAQFLLFVWLPDAMEAPTPASALIHSSTLVVMGIFLILKFSSVLYLSPLTLNIMSLFGALTILYGSLCSIQTSDLKKAVAYSTISQIGYLFCGCALLAIREVLAYLVLHAVCKAMLFVMVGYIVHVCNGTTSMKKMGGLFVVMPDIAAYTFILCLILGGAPYTVGFFVKELIIYNILSGVNQFVWLIVMCWLVALIATPVYLYRICVVPLFGSPKMSYSSFKKIYSLNSFYSFNQFVDYKSNILLRFYKHSTNWLIQGKLIMLLHFVVIILILLFGEFIILLIGGFFNTQTLLFSGTQLEFSSFALNSANFIPSYLLRNFQIFVILMFITVTLYFYFVNNVDNISTIYTLFILSILIMQILVILSIFNCSIFSL